jgi:hypothetical protein
MAAPVKETPKKHPLPPGPGRPKGVPNKTTALLKDAILKAAEEAGGDNGLVGYLQLQAKENPGPFMALLGKVLPMQIAGENGGPVEHVHRIERVIVSPPNRDA